MYIKTTSVILFSGVLKVKEEVKNLYIAVMLSVLVIFGVNYFLPKQNVSQEETAVAPEVVSAQTEAVQQNVTEEKILNVEEVLSANPNVKIKNADLGGSIRVQGARFDNLSLSKYKQSLEENSKDVELLFPSKTKTPYFAEFGWLSADKNIKTPNSETVWEVNGKTLTPETPITFTWDNGQGLKFIKTISVDEHYLFNIAQTVENNTSNPVVLYPYGLISKKVNMEEQKRSVVHEGFSGVIKGSLKEIKFNKN